MNKYLNQIEIRVRGIIFKDDKILVLQQEGKNYYHFPGGHVEFGEQLTETLIRELKEELILEIKDYKLIGTIDNIYIDISNEKHHEVNFIFYIEAEKIQDKSNESNLKVVFLNFEELSSEKILPLSMRDSIIQWKKDKKFFWVTDDLKDKVMGHLE
ncbi:MAG: NUDIX domain-containing protein [Patescibacteria group bacterium]